MAIVTWIITLGDFALFVLDTLRASVGLWRRRGLFIRQCESIGVNSVGVTSAAALFMGAVLGYQLYISLHLFGAEGMLGGTVGAALFRELAPVMTGIMVAGRGGASMAAEISSMQISEQIDALEVMAVDPMEYLVAPRVVAGVLMLPVLTLVFVAVGSLAACLVACGVMDLQYAVYWDQYFRVVDPIDILHCVVKSAAFGLVLTWVGCFNGFRAHGGARAVGRATQNTVVVSCLMILLTDYLLTTVLPFGFKKLEVM